MSDQRPDSSEQKAAARSRAAQALWLGLALVHIAPLISTTTLALSQHASLSAAFNCGAVWLAFAFFALKFLDVPWLRWPLNRANALAFILACALAHQEVRAAAAKADESTVVAAILITGPSLLARFKLPAGLLSRFRALFSASAFMPLVLARWTSLPATRDRRLRVRLLCLIPRAPPC